jgi:SHS family lactate transporter-like MFS transporter
MDEAIDGSGVGKTPGSGAAVLAAFLGWTFDAFDFFLVVICLTAIGREFHKTDKEVALSLTLTLAFRPVGALVFGLLADRYGRRLPLIIDLIAYSALEALTGLAPNFATFLVLRALFGIAMGGEWGVGASLTMEKVPPRLRGILSGLLQEGYAFGNLLAAVAYFVVFPRWGWRPLFFIGGAPALLAIFVRFGVAESEVWQRSKAANWNELTRGILRHWPIFLYLVALMTMMNLSSHGTQDLYPTFLERDWGLGAGRKAELTAISMVGAICGGVIFGYLSDRLGRRKAIAWAFLGAIAAIPIWALPSSVRLLVVGAFALQFMVQGAWGVIPAHICELSPNPIRGFLPGFAYQCGNLIASYIVVLETILAKHWNYGKAMAVSAATIFIVAAVVTLLGRERRAADFG